MFESLGKPVDRWFVIHFVAQQLLAAEGTALAFYYIFFQVEMLLGERFGVNSEVEAWRFLTILSLIALGFGAGYVVQRAWGKAYFAGRFVWILPVLFFILTFVTYVPEFSFATAMKYYRPPHFSFEMMFGTAAYSLGVTKAYRKTQ